MMKNTEHRVQYEHTVICMNYCMIALTPILHVRKVRIRQVELFTQSQLVCDSN